MIGYDERLLRRLAADPSARVEIERNIQRLLNEVAAMQPKLGPDWSGITAWLPEKAEDIAYFGLERCGLTSFDRPRAVPSLRERLRGAWRGLVNGWRSP